MPGIDRLRALDRTLAVLGEGYGFIPARCRRRGTDAFRTQVLGRPVVCVSGAEGGAIDDAARRDRKRMLLDQTAAWPARTAHPR